MSGSHIASTRGPETDVRSLWSRMTAQISVLPVCEGTQSVGEAPRETEHRRYLNDVQDLFVVPPCVAHVFDVCTPTGD